MKLPCSCCWCQTLSHNIIESNKFVVVFERSSDRAILFIYNRITNNKIRWATQTPCHLSVRYGLQHFQLRMLMDIVRTRNNKKLRNFLSSATKYIFSISISIFRWKTTNHGHTNLICSFLYSFQFVWPISDLCELLKRRRVLVIWNLIDFYFVVNFTSFWVAKTFHRMYENS